MLIARIGRYDDYSDPFFVERNVIHISDLNLKCVAFIGTKSEGRFQPRATCFFAGYIEFQYRFDQLVTAEHVVSGLLSQGHEIWVRVNLIDGTTEEFRVPADAFRFHPNNEQEPTDVAVCPISTTVQDESGKYV